MSLDRNTLIVAAGCLGLGLVGGRLIRPSATTSSGNLKACFAGGVSADTPLLNIKGSTVSVKDLPADLKKDWFEAETQQYGRSWNLARETAVRILLAKEKNPGADLTALPPWNELLGDKRVTEADVQRFYEQNKASIPKEISFEKVAPSLRMHLENQRVREVIQGKMAEVARNGDIKILVEPPCSPKLAANVQQHPAKADGKNELVYVTQPFCSQCRVMNQDIESAVALHKDKVRFVNVILPANLDNLGGIYARGGYCATKQGVDKFWKYSELGYQIPFHFETQKTGKEAEDIVLDIAKKSSLKEDEFLACLNAPESREFVEKTKAEFAKDGITMAPALFLNGHRLIVPDQANLSDLIKEAL